MLRWLLSRNSPTYYLEVNMKPILHRLSVVELACKEDDLPLTCELMKARYDENDLSRLLNVATFLDPRYKADFIATSENETNDAEP